MKRSLLVLIVLAGISFVGLRQVVGSEPTAVVTAPYAEGGAAAPPLPITPPTMPFDPSDGIANVDGSVVAVLEGIQLHFYDGGTGSILDEMTVAVGGELRALSAAGDQAAVLHVPTDGSSLVTVVTRGDGSEAFTFLGLIEPEAFSTDGEVLYVIDHNIANASGGYRVRPLDLLTGELQTMLGPTKLPFTDDMNGKGRRQVWAPDGTRLYTLYIRQTHHHHDDGVDHGHAEPGTDGFVHVLDLDDEWAFCLDLPAAFGGGDLAGTALAVSQDGSELAVVDRAANQIAFASTEELAIARTLDLPANLDFGDDELHIALADDAVVLGSGTSLRRLDPDTLVPLAPPMVVEGTIAGISMFGVPGDAMTLIWTPSGDTISIPF